MQNQSQTNHKVYVGVPMNCNEDVDLDINIPPAPVVVQKTTTQGRVLPIIPVLLGFAIMALIIMMNMALIIMTKSCPPYEQQQQDKDWLYWHGGHSVGYAQDQQGPLPGDGLGYPLRLRLRLRHDDPVAVATPQHDAYTTRSRGPHDRPESHVHLVAPPLMPASQEAVPPLQSLRGSISSNSADSSDDSSPDSKDGWFDFD
jgi:hypothetical protein